MKKKKRGGARDDTIIHISLTREELDILLRRVERIAAEGERERERELKRLENK